MEKPVVSKKCTSKCISIATAIFILVSNLLYGSLLCFLAIIGIELFWFHCILSFLEVIATFILLQGLCKGSLCKIKAWISITLAVSLANIIASLVVKSIENVSWNYVFIQLGVGSIFLISAVIVDRHARHTFTARRGSSVMEYKSGGLI